MADKLILERINKRKLDGILEDIQTYFSPVLNVKRKIEDGDLKEKGLFAVKFLHSTVAILGNERVPDHLISAVHICCQVYQIAREHIKLQDELTVPKLVYHIINKIIQEDLSEKLPQLGEFLYDCLHDVPINSTPAVKPIVMNTYSKLWNGSVKHESSCDSSSSLLITTRLRFLAVKFLCKKEKMENSDFDKTEIVVGRYIQLATKLKLKKSVIQKDLGQVLDMYKAMLKHILCIDNDQFYVLVIKSVIRVIKYLSQYKVLGNMQCLLDFIRDLQGDESSKNTSDLPVSLVGAVVEIMNVIKLMDQLAQEEVRTEGSYDEVAAILTSSNERLMVYMDSSPECGGQALMIILEICQLLMIQMNSLPLSNLLTISLMDAARMTMTLYLNFLESEWREISETGAPTSGLKRDQIERYMLDAFHVKFQMFYRLMQITTDDDQFKSLMGECLDAVGLYLNVLGVVESDKTRFDDKYYFGYLMVKLAHFCYNKNLNEPATELYRNTCQQLTEWCFSDEEKKQDRIEETQLWKIYKFLAECHRRRQMWQEALETIATYLHFDGDRVTTLVQLWVRIKKDAARDGHQHFTEKTLKDVFSGNEKRNAELIPTLLQAELEAFKDFKKRWNEGEAVVLQDLIAVTVDPNMKAGHLLSLAQVLWITGIEAQKSAKDCVSEIFDMTTTASPVGCIVRGQAHIWHFIITREDLCKEYVEPQTDPDPDLHDDDTSSRKTVKDEPWVLCKVYTLQQSETDMADMEQALELLGRNLEGDVPQQIDRRSLVDNLILAASVFRLFRKPVQELQILCLALRVCLVDDIKSVTQIRQAVSRVLLECGQYHVAEVSLPGGGDNGLTCDDFYQKILLQLQRDRIHLTQKMESGLTRTLSVVRDLVKTNNKSWTATLTEGIAKRLLSMYLIKPLKARDQDANYALSLAQEAVKLHTAVVHFLMGKDLLENTRNKGEKCIVVPQGRRILNRFETSTDPNVFDRWMVVTELLESILHLGQLYRHVGDAKDARCYFKEGLKITKSLCLPQWTIEFLLELGRINALSCNEKESVRLLAETSMVLRSGSSEVDNGLGAVTAQKQQKSSVGTKSVSAKKQRANRGKIASTSRNNCKVVAVEPVDDCFGFESVRDAGMKRPSESDVTSMLSTLTLSEDVDLPESKPHTSGCSCQLCQDIVVQGLEMLFAETLGEFYQYSGSLEKGWEELKKIESSKSALNKLTESITAVMHEHLKSANIISVVKNKKSKLTELSPVLLPSIKQLSIESYGLLAQTALKKCESDTAGFLSKSALEMLDSDTNKDLLQQSFLKAQLQLLQIQAKIQAGGDVFASSDKPVKPVPARGRSRAASKRKPSSRKGKADTEEADPPTESDARNNCVKETLTDAFGNICHFPSSDVYGRLCRMLACQHLDTDQVKTAYYLGEAVSITFRHQALANTSRKIRKLEKELVACAGESDSEIKDGLEDLKHVRSLLTFNKDVSHFQQMLKYIPPEWTVCQITMVKGPDDCTKLLLTRLTGQTDPVTVQLPGMESVQGRSVLPEFKSIMKTSNESMKLTDKNVWWQTRRDLNDGVQSVLEIIEKYWLGKWRCLLQGQLLPDQSSVVTDSVTQLQKDIKKTCKMIVEEPVLEMLVTLCLCPSINDHKEVVVKLLSLDAESDVAEKLTSIVSKCCSKINSTDTNQPSRQPVLLVLDKDIQHLPWESLPCLRHQPVTRIPSLYHLHTQLSVSRLAESHACVRGVNLQDTFYILNPDSDLMSTQESFMNLFSSQSGWTGITGVKPDHDQFKSALTQHDLFIYCGHGSGGKYFSGSDLQQLRCRAVAVLMGCSSGYLQTHGILEATGMINNYFLAGCPTIIANLWDVTDRDIDRFLEGILASWMSSDGEGSLLDAIPAARDLCRLPFLIGAAPVVYGFPVSFTR